VTGTYKGRQVIDIDAKLAKKEAKRQQKAKEAGQDAKKTEEEKTEK